MMLTSLLRRLIYGVVVLQFVSAIEFRGYKLYDPTNGTTETLQVQGNLPVEVASLKEYQVNLPPESGKPEAFQVMFLGSSTKVRIVRNLTKGTAHRAHLVYADMPQKMNTVFDVAEGRSAPINCEDTDAFEKKGKVRCVAIASVWMSNFLPSKLIVFQHVVHSKLHVFLVTGRSYIFYLLREDESSALQIDIIDKDAPVKLWYDENVKFDKKKPLTLGFLTANTTKYGRKFALIGEFTKPVKEEDVPGPGTGTGQRNPLVIAKKFELWKRSENADVSKCMDEYVTLGPTRITFRELDETIIFVRNMDELSEVHELDCFARNPHNGNIQTLGTSETPDRLIENDEITIYEARASPSKPFYAVAITYKPEFDNVKHKHQFAMVNSIVFQLDDLRHAGEVVYQMVEPTEMVQLFRSTPAIKLTVFDYTYAFKVFPYWIDQSMTHMEYEPLHNYFEAILHGGPLFKPDSVWADIIITKELCVNTSLLNVSLAKLVEHHQEKREINGTMKTFERDMAQTYEEYEDFHVDQRNPCNAINLLSQIKRTTRKVSKHEEIVLEATDKEPIRVTLNLEEGEKFLLRFSSVEREASKCQDLDTIAVFLKDGILINEKAYIRTITYEALRTRNKAWVGTGKLTIAIPNGCFSVSIVSTYSIQRANNLRALRKCLTVLGLTFLMSGTFIALYYKFSLAGREFRRLRRLYRRAKRNDNLVRHYLKWNENIEEILTQWEKVAEDH